MDDAVLLRHLDALEPVGKSLRDVLLPEALLADAGRVALHRDRAALDVRQDHRRHRFVVRRQVALRDPIVREQEFFGMRDHDSLTTSRAALSKRTPIRRGCRSLLLPVHSMKDDLHDDLTAAPSARAGAAGPVAIGERRLRNLERIEALAQIEQQLGVEAGADLSRRRRNRRRRSSRRAARRGRRARLADR